MTIQINVGDGWENLPHTAEIPEGFLAGAHNEGGFALAVMHDQGNPGWVAMMKAQRSGAAVAFREGPDGEAFKFQLHASMAPDFLPNAVATNTIVCRSAD